MGGAIYLLNLGTLQHFYVPFEMFCVQFAFLPWLFYLILKYLREGKKKNIFLFALVSVLALPMAYAPALFYAYFGALIIFLFFYLLLSKFNKRFFGRAVLLVIATLTINAFWLLPNIYSVSHQAGIIENAKINVLFSPEAALRNLDHGNIKDVLINKSFLFDWKVFDLDQNKYVDLMGNWNNYLANPWIIRIFYTLAGISILGLVISIVKKNKIALSLIPVTIYSLFFLVNANYQTGALYNYLYTNFGLFKEGLRMPFTKFSLLYIFITSFFFASFFFYFLNQSRKVVKAFGFILSIVIFVSLIISMKPALEGNFISKVVKKDLPKEYLELFSWFKDKDGRIAKLPLSSLWDWQNNNWGYEGSGFLTFGLANPLMDRDFDRWSAFNETFYNQSSFALYNQDLNEFENILKKYQIKYLLLDESIINAGGSQNLLYIPEIKDLLTRSQYITKKVSFGFITVYEANWDIGKDYISTPKKYIGLNIDTLYSQIDPLFTKYGDYYQDEKSLGYPFINLDIRSEVSIISNEKNLIFSNKSKNASVISPLKDLVIEDLSKNRGFTQATNCDIEKIGNVSKEIIQEGIAYKAEGGGVSCDFLPFPDFKYSQGYVLHIQGRNLEGRSLKIYLHNSQTGRMDLEELLPEGNFNMYYPVLPQKLDGKGYTLNLETRSFGSITSENILEKVEFIPFSFDFLTGLIQKGEKEETSVFNNLTVVEQKQITPLIWKLKTKGEGLLELGQGYEKGWLAFGGKIAKKNLLTHVKVNGWANGWFVPEGESSVYIFFWPQGLEWVGMLLGLLFLCFSLSSSHKRQS